MLYGSCMLQMGSWSQSLSSKLEERAETLRSILYVAVANNCFVATVCASMVKHNVPSFLCGTNDPPAPSFYRIDNEENSCTLLYSVQRIWAVFPSCMTAMILESTLRSDTLVKTEHHQAQKWGPSARSRSSEKVQCKFFKDWKVHHGECITTKKWAGVFNRFQASADNENHRFENLLAGQVDWALYYSLGSCGQPSTEVSVAKEKGLSY